MGAVTGILAISIIILIIEAPLLVNKPKKDILVFFILLFFGLFLNIAMGLHKHIPNPLDWITIIFEPVSKSIYNLL